jgi:hypothetical protein
MHGADDDPDKLEDVLELVAADQIEHLELDGSPDSPILLSGIMRHEFPKLVHLSFFLCVPTSAGFFALLDGAPLLKSLHLEYFDFDRVTTIAPRIPLILIPALRSYAMPFKPPI